MILPQLRVEFLVVVAEDQPPISVDRPDPRRDITTNKADTAPDTSLACLVVRVVRSRTAMHRADDGCN
jgi:hypothetical protein